MKLSETTVAILKNFYSINNGLLFRVGNTLKTISPNKALYAEATVDESFPKEFGIYDLGKILGLLSLYQDAELSFEEQNLVLKSGRSRTQIRYTDKALIQTPPEGKSIKSATYDVDLKLSKDDLEWVEKVGSILGCPYIVISNNEGRFSVEAVDVKGEIVDNSSLDIGEATNSTPFKFVLKVENLKLLEGDYDIAISSRGLARFTNKNVTYYVAVEQGSSFYGEPKA
jgi:hypothetical protein